MSTSDAPPPALPSPHGASAAAPPTDGSVAVVDRPRGGFRRGFGLGLGASLGVAVVVAVLGVLLSVVLVLATLGAVGAASGSSSAEEPLTTTVWGEPDATGRLLAVPVEGTIMGSAGDGVPLGAAAFGYDIAATIDDLDADDADGLVLEMNTPGGTIYGSRAIADAVGRYQERTGKKVVAFVRGLSASGGMYAMAGADEILVDHGSLVGSIGVVSGPFERYRDVTGTTGSLLEQGVTTEGGITSEYLTQGRGKDFGNPYRDMTQEERDVWNAGLAREYADFVDAVSQGRGIPAQTIVDDLGAYLYDGGTAVDKGLADQVLGQEEAYREAATTSGTDPDDTRVDRITGPTLLESLLSASAARVAGTSAQAVGAEDLARTSVVCAGSDIILAFHGDLSALCPAP